jgi:hypothetical protein
MLLFGIRSETDRRLSKLRLTQDMLFVNPYFNWSPLYSINGLLSYFNYKIIHSCEFEDPPNIDNIN